MMFPPPFAGVAPRLAWLRVTLLAACFLTLLASAPLWTNARPYPTLPIAAGFPVPSQPWDLIAFAGVLACLLLSGWFYRAGVISFLLGSLFLALGDQSRWQPWFYMYWTMLALSLAPDRTASAACRFVVSATYVWGGIQKLNPGFFQLVAPWFVKPAAAWLPPGGVAILQWAIASAPVLEIFIGVAIWFPRTRRLAALATLVVHFSALLFLGPLGHQHNWIIWPWNIVMPILVLVLFPFHETTEGWSALRLKPWAVTSVALIWLLPVLSFFGRWDSYLSFSLYSGNLARADLFISSAVRERLPPAVLPFVVPTPAPYNEELQGPYVVLIEYWADKVLCVPALPEPRSYRNVAAYVARLAADPNDVRLVLIPRVGSTLFYRGGDLRPSAGVPLDF